MTEFEAMFAKTEKEVECLEVLKNLQKTLNVIPKYKAVRLILLKNDQVRIDFGNGRMLSMCISDVSTANMIKYIIALVL